MALDPPLARQPPPCAGGGGVEAPHPGLAPTLPKRPPARSGGDWRRAAGYEDRAIGAADDIARDAPAEAPAPRAEHDQPRPADAGELDDAGGGVARELLAGGGHARSRGDLEDIVQGAAPAVISASRRRW